MIRQIVGRKLDSNCYIICEGNDAIVIDPNDSYDIAKVIAENALNVEYIFLTHEHYDHIYGLEELRSKAKAPLVVNSRCSENIQNVKGNLSNIADILAYYRNGELAKEKTPRFTCRAAEITYGEAHEIEWRGHRFCFTNIPGHSQGSVLICLDDEKYFTGDYMIPGEELLLRLRGGSKEDFANIALPILKKIPIGALIYPGHGEAYHLKEAVK